MSEKSHRVLRSSVIKDARLFSTPQPKVKKKTSAKTRKARQANGKKSLEVINNNSKNGSFSPKETTNTISSDNSTSSSFEVSFKKHSPSEKLSLEFWQIADLAPLKNDISPPKEADIDESNDKCKRKEKFVNSKRGTCKKRQTNSVSDAARANETVHVNESLLQNIKFKDLSSPTNDALEEKKPDIEFEFNKKKNRVKHRDTFEVVEAFYNALDAGESILKRNQCQKNLNKNSSPQDSCMLDDVQASLMEDSPLHGEENSVKPKLERSLTFTIDSPLKSAGRKRWTKGEHLPELFKKADSYKTISTLGTSTPCTNNVKEKAVFNKNSNNNLRQVINKCSSIKKMPNFEKIHKKMYDNMENLGELQERKAKRAKCLLSGKKPLVTSTSSSTNTEQRAKRTLTFPLEFQSVPIRDEVETGKSTNSTLQLQVNGKNDGKKFNFKFKSKLPVPILENKKIEEKVKQNPILKKPLTKFGFKFKPNDNVTSAANKASSKLKQIDAIIHKRKIAVDKREEKRNILKGVRSNRRFDLLMKLREKEK